MLCNGHSFSEEGDKYLLVSVVCHFFYRIQKIVLESRYVSTRSDWISSSWQSNIRLEHCFPLKLQKYIPTTSIFLSRTIRLKAINKDGQSSQPITNTLICINSQSISHNNLASLFERKLKFHQSSLFNYHPHLQFISSPSSPSDIRTIDEPHLPIEKTFRSVVNFETKTGSLETQRRGSFFCSISHSRDSHAKTSVSDNKGTSQGCLDIVRRCRLTGAERARNTRWE